MLHCGPEPGSPVATLVVDPPSAAAEHLAAGLGLALAGAAALALVGALRSGVRPPMIIGSAAFFQAGLVAPCD